MNANEKKILDLDEYVLRGETLPDIHRRREVVSTGDQHGGRHPCILGRRLRRQL